MKKALADVLVENNGDAERYNTQSCPPLQPVLLGDFFSELPTASPH